jgi:hypothetical protein
MEPQIVAFAGECGNPAFPTGPHSFSQPKLGHRSSSRSESPAAGAVQTEIRTLEKGRKARKTAHEMVERRGPKRHMAEFAPRPRLLAVEMKMS